MAHAEKAVRMTRQYADYKEDAPWCIPTLRGYSIPCRLWREPLKTVALQVVFQLFAPMNFQQEHRSCRSTEDLINNSSSASGTGSFS